MVMRGISSGMLRAENAEGSRFGFEPRSGACARCRLSRWDAAVGLATRMLRWLVVRELVV